MKKVKFLIVSLISVFAFSVDVFAASGSLEVSSSSVYVGDGFTVTANVSSAAAWNIHVSASGPVSGCSINQADATADAMDANKTFSATCTATGTGTITIRLSGDVTSALDGNAVNVSGSRSVNVSNRPTAPSNNNNTNNNNNASSNNNNDYSNNNNQVIDNRSKNNNIKELSIEGYDLTKVDNNNYTLSVSNDVTSINIKASAEDSKSKVTGVGGHDINVGENNIEVIVTAENGSQNKINIKVTRKDGYYLEDLDAVLKNNKIDDINITIKSDTKITAQDLEKIKSSGKFVKFNYYNDDKSLLYSWTIDGKKIKGTDEFLTTVMYDSDNKKDILKLSNYADGVFVGLKQKDSLPNGTKIKLYVGNKYEDNDLVNVYGYVKNDNKLELIGSKLKLQDGYVEFDISDSSDYLVTMSNISSLTDKDVLTTGARANSFFLPLLIVIIVSLIILLVTLLIILKRRKVSRKDLMDESEVFSSDVLNYNNNDLVDNTSSEVNLSNQTVNNSNDFFGNQNSNQVNNNSSNIVFENQGNNQVNSNNIFNNSNDIFH